VHVPEIGADAGTGCPFGIFAVHVPANDAPVALSHHCDAVQSPSPVHAVPQAPLPRLQIEPAWLPAQSPFPVHLPHEPSAAQ
jgi:hypothetical protein